MIEISTIRKCNGCSYRTFILTDMNILRKCKYCKGNLEIIAVGGGKNE